MRRHAVAAAIAAAVLMHGPAVARASVRHRSTAPTTTPAPPPANALTVTVPGAVSGAPATTALHPGSSTTVHVTVANGTSADRLNIAVTTVDAILQPNGTIVAGSTTGAQPGSGVSSWLGLGDTALMLQPGASVDVPVTVSVPPEAAGGSVAAVVRATITHAAAIGNPVSQREIALTGVTASANVRIDVQAPKRAELNVTSVSVGRDHGAREIRIAIANIGTSAAPVTGSLMMGAPPVTQPISANIAPHGTTTVQLPWPKSLPTNKPANATVTVHHRDDNAQWSGTLDPNPAKAASTPKPAASGSPSPSSGGGLGVPWWVLAAIALAIGWLGYEVFAANKARTSQPIPRSQLPTGGPYVGMGATAALHEELEPLVAAISALAQSMQPRAPGADPTSENPVAPTVEDAGAEWVEPFAPAHPVEPFEDLEAFEPIEHSVDADAVVASELVALYDYEEDGALGAHAVELPVEAAPVVAIPVAGGDTSEPELRPWAPHVVVVEILEALADIDTHPTKINVPGSEPIEVLPPDDLVNAVASALTVAPATVRHWLSNETLEAATRAIEAGPQDAENLVRERQVLAAQVEVLKRALSDLG
jgi:hypothetical protein